MTHLFLLAAAVMWCAQPAQAQAPAKAEPNAPTPAKAVSEEARADYRAQEMLNNGIEIVTSGQEERGIKLISSVIEMFPKSKVRYHASLALGKIHMEKGRHEIAVKQLKLATESEDPDEQAEAIYLTGVCYYTINDYDKAFTTLRKVTNDFPWSVFANESYYYIGQCHFKQNRWAKAIEALEMVGTSVPLEMKAETLAEAGQRLYVKVFDKDLVVLMNEKKKLQVSVTASGGDHGTITLEPLGKGGEYYIGSIPTAPGEPNGADGVLHFIGPETVNVCYIDENTQDGRQNIKRISTVKLVSTATAGFTDGAFREYTHGVFGDQECFVRVKDLVKCVKGAKASVKVRVTAQYKPPKEEGQPTTSEDDEKPKFRTRDSVELTLTEQQPYTGIFCGMVVPHVVQSADAVLNDGKLYVMKGDELLVEYVNDINLTGETRTANANAKVLLGQIQDVKSEYYYVKELDQRARKNLIEAKIYLKLGEIFKEVGLLKNASAKADEGLTRIDDVISTSLTASLDRSIVEEAFSVKWELLLIQDKLAEAINVCRTLTHLFPDSTLVDKALLKIGLVKMDGEKPDEAIGIFNSVISLPKSDCKAEAQFDIGRTLERIAKADPERLQPQVMSRAMLAYKDCAEKYPDSSFAGDALEKIADYYIEVKDYARASELMDRVFQDYPDANFLDRMLYKWVVVAYRMGNMSLAHEKAQELLSQYPNSHMAVKARAALDQIDKKGGAEPSPEKPPQKPAEKTGAGE